jgi:hypothetical protein
MGLRARRCLARRGQSRFGGIAHGEALGGKAIKQVFAPWGVFRVLMAEWAASCACAASSDFWAIFGYIAAMPKVVDRLSPEEIAVARKRRLEAMHLQVIEGNPFDEDDIAMFEMFEREGWDHERRRAYILSRARALAK